MLTAMLRTTILYLLLIVGLRLAGKRQLGELEPVELVLAMLLSDLAAVPMQDFGIPLLHGIVPIITLLALSTLLSYASMRSVRVRRLICGSAAVIIDHGRIVQDAMRRNRLTMDELMEELRAQGISQLNQVKFAILETGGQLSVLTYPEESPLTPRQLGLSVTDDVVFPTVLISDGRILTDRLNAAGYDRMWLERTLRQNGAQSARQVFFLSVDGGGQITCVMKEDKA